MGSPSEECFRTMKKCHPQLMAAKMFEFSPDGGRIFSEGTASSKKALNRTCRQVNIMIELYNARVLPITNNDG